MPTGTIPGATNTRRHPDADASLDKTVRFEPTADLRATSGDFFFFLATSPSTPPFALSARLSSLPLVAHVTLYLASPKPNLPLTPTHPTALLSRFGSSLLLLLLLLLSLFFSSLFCFLPRGTPRQFPFLFRSRLFRLPTPSSLSFHSFRLLSVFLARLLSLCSFLFSSPPRAPKLSYSLPFFFCSLLHLSTTSLFLPTSCSLAFPFSLFARTRALFISNECTTSLLLALSASS